MRRAFGPWLRSAVGMQCVVAMFAEDIGLLPLGLFAELLRDSKRAGGNSYDLLGGLFGQMAKPDSAEGGRFKDVPYFNGGLFDKVEAVELRAHELELLSEAAAGN